MKHLKCKKLFIAFIATIALAVCLALCLAACDENPPYTPPTGNPKYDVSFETNGGRECATINSSFIAETPYTEKDDYIFDGWYTGNDFENSNLVVFPYTPQKDITLYAKWKPTSKFIQLITNGNGTITAPSEENPNDIIQSFTHSTQHTIVATAAENFVFSGWYDDNGAKLSDQSEFTFTMPKHDISYTAKFTTVSAIYSEEFENPGIYGFKVVGNNYVFSAKPYLGYEFAGWYEPDSDKLLSDKSDFTLPPSENNVKIKTKWRIVPEMADFEFASTFDKCVITGVKNQEKTSFTLPNYVTEIGDNAFRNHESITQIILPDGLTKIGDYAFSTCQLSSIKIPDSVTSIGKHAFAHSALKSIEIGKGLAILGECALDAGALKDITVSDQNAHFSVYENVLYNKNQTQILFVPEATKTLKIASGISEIAEEAFSGYGFENIILPDSITQIGKKAFFNCRSLKSANLGGGIISIGEKAFSGCTLLETVIIGAASQTGNSGLTIDSLAFYYCNRINTLTVLKDVEAISNDAFIHPFENMYVSDISSWCTLNCKYSPVNLARNFYIQNEAVSYLQIPDTVESISAYAFSECQWMTSLAIPDSVTAIGEAAFFGCDNLESISIGNGIKTIRERAFEINQTDNKFDLHIKGLDNWCNIKLGNNSNPIEFAGKVYFDGELTQSLIIPDGVTAISYNAFYGFNAITSLKLPDSVKTIGTQAFRGCKNLAELDLGNGVEIIISGAFLDCQLLSTVSIPKSVKEIEGSAFPSYRTLDSITVDAENTNYYVSGNCLIETATKSLILVCNEYEIPTDGSVTKIKQAAFFCQDNIGSFTVPEGIEDIEMLAFYYCKNLGILYLPNSLKHIGSFIVRSTAITDIYFNGTIEEWIAVEKDAQWDTALGQDNSGFTVHCTDGDIEPEA